MAEPDPQKDLLAAHHEFPGHYRFKVIASASDDFDRRLSEVVLSELTLAEHLTVSSRATPGGRHVAVTLDVYVDDPDHVRRIYAKIRGLEGIVMML